MEVLSHLAYLLKYHLPLPAMTSCLNFQRFQLHSASPRLFLAGTVRETPLHGSLVLGLARGDSDRRASGVSELSPTAKRRPPEHSLQPMSQPAPVGPARQDSTKFDGGESAKEIRGQVRSCCFEGIEKGFPHELCINFRESIHKTWRINRRSLVLPLEFTPVSSRSISCYDGSHRQSAGWLGH